MPIDQHHIFSSYWWSERFFWERSLEVIPHAVVFVFDGSLEPFLAGESLPFFKHVFEDCTSYGEPFIQACNPLCLCLPSTVSFLGSLSPVVGIDLHMLCVRL